jgi:hypothetical protein
MEKTIKEDDSTYRKIPEIAYRSLSSIRASVATSFRIRFISRAKIA